MPCASPDSLLLVSDVALVGELLAFCATIGLETRQNTRRSSCLGINTTFSDPRESFGELVMQRKAGSDGNPLESQLKHASVEMTKGFAFKPQFLLLMPAWGKFPHTHESLSIFNLSKPSIGVV